jgi:formylglycine-generating enzyme required for sulfatase activity
MVFKNELFVGLLLAISSLLTWYGLTDKKAHHENDPVPFEEFSQSIEGTDKVIEMVPVPGGQFIMGSDEFGGSHEVELDSFWISKYEITWDLYSQFADASLEDLRRDLFKMFYGVDIDADAISSPTLTDEVLEVLREADIPADVISTPSPSWGDLTRGMGTDGYPAVNVTHYAAYMFTKWLTVKTGNFYRLPTEAEWELACRGGIDGDGHPGDVEQFAWHSGNSDRTYHHPGSKEPNSLGIHDMLGNVAEWTFDQYHDDYIHRLEGESAVNPWFRPDELYPRAVRGGSWMDTKEQASCFQRRGSDPNWKRDDPQLPKSLWWHTNAFNIGFRVVKPVNQPDTAEEMEEYWIEAVQDYN